MSAKFYRPAEAGKAISPHFVRRLTPAQRRWEKRCWMRRMRHAARRQCRQAWESADNGVWRYWRAGQWGYQQ